MPHLLTSDGTAALARLLPYRPLMAFDFDGTLAPIVAEPADACVPPALAQALQALSHRFTVAVVSGRAVADLRDRLGFHPHHVVGNHGAEDGADAAAEQALCDRLQPLRDMLALHASGLSQAGIRVEDKRLSLALHYRQSAHPAQALALIESLVPAADPRWHVHGGKRVVNVGVAGAPDKAAAVLELVRKTGAGAAFFAGDDVNDEPVFAAAPPHWVTVRVGADGPPTQARWTLDSPADMLSVVQQVLSLSGTGR